MRYTSAGQTRGATKEGNLARREKFDALVSRVLHAVVSSLNIVLYNGRWDAMEHPSLGPDIVSERRTTLLIQKVRVEQIALRNLNDRYDV